MIEDKEATIKVMEALRDASDIRFSKMEEHMSRMEHDVSAQRVENKQLDNACRHMADELWIISRNYSVQQDRVKKLEEAMIIANEHLLESQTSHIGSDAKVTVLQVRIQDLELKWEWINKQGEDYNVTMGLIQERLDTMEESVDSLAKGVVCCDRVHHQESRHPWVSQRHVNHLYNRVNDIEDHLLLAGWVPRVPRQGEVPSEVEEEEEEESETGVVPHLISSPANSQFLGSPSLFVGSELEIELLEWGEGESTIVVGENVVPLPVVRRSTRSSRKLHSTPYSSPPASSSSRWVQASHVNDGRSSSPSGSNLPTVGE